MPTINEVFVCLTQSLHKAAYIRAFHVKSPVLLIIFILPKCPKISMSNGLQRSYSEKGSFQRFSGSGHQLHEQMDIFPVSVYWIQIRIAFGEECDKRFIAKVRVLMWMVEELKWVNLNVLWPISRFT